MVRTRSLKKLMPKMFLSLLGIVLSLNTYSETNKTYYCEYEDTDHLDSTMVVVNKSNEIVKVINPITGSESIKKTRFYEEYDPSKNMVVGSIPANDRKGCNEVLGSLSEDAKINLNIRKLKADPNTAKLIKKSFIRKFVVHNIRNNNQCSEVAYILSNPYRLVCTDNNDDTRWIEFTKKEAKSLEIVKLKKPLSKKLAKRLCREEIKSRLSNPKSYAYQGSSTNTVTTTGITAVVINFAASNLLGETINYEMVCHYNADAEGEFKLTESIYQF